MRKPSPEEGMAVAWIDPKEEKDPRDSLYISRNLIEGIGSDGLTIDSVDPQGTGYQVTLRKNGKVLKDPAFSGPRWFSWHYLRPVSKKQDDSGHSDFGAGLS